MNERLRILREQAGLSQEQLAGQIHIMRQAISKWELGHAEPSIEVLIALAQLYDVTIDYIVTGKQTEEPVAFILPKTTTELVLHFAQENKGMIIAIVAILSGLIISINWASHIMVCRLVRVKVKILRSTVMLSSVIAETVTACAVSINAEKSSIATRYCV
ncbi:transcriptional repressor DicA [Metalysinibacillus saudimassiliensis]|uniref:Transcriptional repressor DicA n=1 Tax=Metalysinibacillus saudimassiliensis TaxID=1461583 RepID=A0A078MH17_9BACL|nr:transcriptional repressor DicA [Metalysinibacillus saudimassiliensis]